MTDKEIIIDGIDVSECYGYVHNAKEYDCGETYSKFHYRYCKENPNCYFKQLKRKEQELQQAMDNYVQLDLQRVKEYNELVDLYKAKEQECEEKQKTAQDAISKLCAEKSALYNELDKLKRDNDLFRTCHDNEQEKRRKYEQTLIEIKPVLELYANSRIGEEQLDGTYKIIVEDLKVLGEMYITFDPRPAKQALQKNQRGGR